MLNNSRAHRPLPDWVYSRAGLVTIVIVLLAALSSAYVAWTLRDMPDPGQDNVLARSIVVYDRHGAYGLGAASRAYFSKDAKDLSPAQAAFLAGLVQAPYYYDPQTHFDRAKARQDYVLKGMVQTGALTQDEADRAAQQDVQTQIKYDNSFRKSKAPLFVDYVVQKLEAQFGQATIQQGGFAVYTTLD